ncbi:MAG: hypothetical protein FWF50_05415 [Defluviitaleaceae bacterium]|nr:hypothetical protein [Defluviitaleaceae bacterium]
MENKKKYIKLHKKTGIAGKFKKENLAKLLLPKLASMFANLVSIGPRIILRSAFQLLRANIWTRLLSTFVLVAFDLYSYARRKISTKQFIINIILSLMLLLGGTAGWIVGTNSALVVVAENTMLWVIAGIIGAGILSGLLDFAAKKVLGKFIKTDVENMLEIFNEEYEKICIEKNIENIEELAKHIKITEKNCIDCYSVKDKHKFAKDFIKKEMIKYSPLP